jgi:hypothetical protein
MADIAPNRANVNAAAQIGKVGRTIQSNGLTTPEPTPGPEAERIAADQLRQSIEISELGKFSVLKLTIVLIRWRRSRRSTWQRPQSLLRLKVIGQVSKPP